MMKKKIKKCIFLIMATITFATSFTACKNGKSNSDANISEPGSIEKTVFNGTHIFNYAPTSDFLVKDGTTEYKIVFASKQTSSDTTAVTELIYFFKKATGITLTAIPDTDLEYSPNTKYISIGDTNLLKTCDTLDKKTDDLVKDGYRIETEGKTIFIFSNNIGKGTLYGVYQLLELTFNYEQYARDVMTIEQNVQTKALYDYQVKDMPDILSRADGLRNIYSNIESYDNSMFNNRMRLEPMQQNSLPMHIETPGDTAFAKPHNSCTQILPAHLYEEKWEKWYSTSSIFTSDDQAQFCWTARGDETEFEAMTDEVAKKIQDSLMFFTPETHPQYEYVEINNEDTNNFCKCDACLADYEKYGTYTGSTIIFMNRVAEKVKEWMEKEENASYRRENFGFRFFAYMSLFEEAPVKKNVNDEWVAIDEKVVPRDDLIIYLALIGSLEYKESIYAPINDKGRERIEKWGAIAKQIHTWLYAHNFDMTPYYYDCYDFYSECYALLAKNNVTYSFAESDGGQTKDAMEFKKLRSWIQNKLMWNSSLNAGELTSRWFKGMYGSAGESMEKLFYEIRTYNKHMNNKFHLYALGSIFEDVNVPEYWPLQTLMGWADRFQEIKKEAEIYKGIDDARYEQICYYIDSEWASPVAIMLELYYDSLPKQKKDSYFQQFKQVVSDHQFTSWGYSFKMDEFIKKCGG